MGVDDEGRLLLDAAYMCSCGRRAPLPLPALSALATRWTRDDDPHFEPDIARRFAPFEQDVLEDGAFIVQLVCACARPASMVFRLRDERGVERVVALGVIR